MTYATDLTSRVDTSSVAYPVRFRVSGRERSFNVGYILFAFGVLWVLAIAAVMVASPRSMPECQLTVLGDTAICSPSTRAETPASGTHAGLDVSKMAIPVGLSGSGYDAF